MKDLTDEQCDEFRRLPCSFNDMVRAIYKAGAEDRAPRVPDATAMADRLMGWPLPKGFSPDCGISFDGRKDDEWNKNKTWPTGTNLLTHEQATAMFEYVLSAAPAQPEQCCEHPECACPFVAQQERKPIQPANILPAFMGLPLRKLDELLSRGYQINGLAFERRLDGSEDTERGFVTVAGMVGWWSNGEHAQRAKANDTEGGHP